MMIDLKIDPKKIGLDLPFVSSLCMIPGVLGPEFVMLEIDVREVSHIVVADKGYPRVSMKNGEMHYLASLSEYHIISQRRKRVYMDAVETSHKMMDN